MKRITPALLAAALAPLLSWAGAVREAGVGAAGRDLTGGGDLSEQARRALARMPAEERLAEIRDESVRRAVQAAYRAVAEIADNREPGRSAAHKAKFGRAYAAVRRAAARTSYKTCAHNCEGDGAACRSACASADRKSCECRLATFACFVAECVL